MISPVRNPIRRAAAWLVMTLGIGAAVLLGGFVAFAGPQNAVPMLLNGNARFQQGKLAHPNTSPARVAETAAGQHPLAVVLTCADSRVSPELIFDRGIGDLFVVRNAGNVVDPVVTGSIEYAVEHLHVPQVIVLGHTRCGAVTAAVQGGHAEGSIGAILQAIVPAVQQTKTAHPTLAGDPLVDAVSTANAHLQASHLTRSPIISQAVKTGHVTITSAMYDLRTGAVTLLKAPAGQ